MRAIGLSLKNIGPFNEAELQFLPDETEPPPVTLITGENGTGKTIILDAIRAAFGHHYGLLNRTIDRTGFDIQLQLRINNKMTSLATKKKGIIKEKKFQYDPTVQLDFHSIPALLSYNKTESPNWIVDFWRSSLATDSFVIQGLAHRDHEKFLMNALEGKHQNVEVTQTICYFDYLRDSRDPKERQVGEMLYEILEKIVELSLLDGKLSHVSRATFEPIVIQNGQSVGLASLSSGNLYLIQHMVSLLAKMYSVHVLRNTAPEQICQTPGLLLIDEAENHLHPKWQKRFIPSILEIFPNLQIIATTHSPFIISSVRDARIFVCESRVDHSVVRDVSAEYSNLPVDEILASPLFGETHPFNEEISKLMEQRQTAIEAGNKPEQERLEALLLEKNPSYFSYFKIDRLVAQISQGSSS